MFLDQITVEQKRLIDRALAENRGFTDAEQREYDDLERQWERGQLKNLPIKPTPEKIGERKENMENYQFNESGTSQRDIFNRYLKYGVDSLAPAEFRALQGDKDVLGGFLQVPVEVASAIFADLDNELFIRKLATVFKVQNAESFRVPKMDHDFGSPTWTAELGTGSEDSNMNFEAVQFNPRPLARRIKISNDLLRISHVAPEAFVRQRMAQVLSQVLENAYLNGVSPGPLGVFVASNSGISTARDVTASSTTEVKYDDLISAVGTLKYQWRKGAVWVCSRTVETQLRKLKDGMGRPILENPIDATKPPSLLGFPLYVSEYAPTTMTSGNYVMALGNFQYYYIIDGMNVQVTRLVELYAETNQLGLIIRYTGDGNVVSENAFVRVKLG